MVVGEDSMRTRAELLRPDLVRWRREIHAHPELSFREFQTSALVTRTLDVLEGIAVQTGVGRTGVVGRLGSGAAPTIAIRADMDALPIHEQTDHAFRSRHDGVMHACGHDAHTAILLGVAHLLHGTFRREGLSGTARLLFQPAEEAGDGDGVTGAVHMINGGALEGVDACIALHMNPERPVGTFWVNPGYTMASVDTFEGQILTSGGHAAYPHLGTDPTWMLAIVLQSLHAIVSRKVSPMDAAVVSVGEIHAGTADNVLPSDVTLRGTLRSYRPAVREKLIAQVKRSFSLVESMGGRHRIELVRGEPALNNHPVVNDQIARTIRDLYPRARVEERPFGMGGEDFGHITERIPGAMFMLGSAAPSRGDGGLHTRTFDLDEAALPMGAAVLAETARRFLRGEWTPVEDRAATRPAQ